MDTQWPRFEVFIQEKEGQPHKHVGSVHAPDPEMALLNARDVYTRRPSCLSLWVIPDTAIFAKTAQELHSPSWFDEPPPKEAQPRQFYLFHKPHTSGTLLFAGEVQAASAAQALQVALEASPRFPPPFAWWVCPAERVFRSKAEDAGPLFEPAHSKPFRHQSYYHTHTTMRKLRREK
jgi:ring-1,2-phenylacetyl-CoA epoxidase subunit PaaB